MSPKTLLKEHHLEIRENHEPLLDRKTAARYLSVSPATLAVWDCTKRYDLKPIKIGRSVRYRRSYLDQFLESQLKEK